MKHKLTRKQISACRTKEALIELHSNANYMEPGYNKGASIKFADSVLLARSNKAKKTREIKVVKFWQDVD